MIDWQKPIEAVHTDGRTALAELRESSMPDCRVAVWGTGSMVYSARFYDNGRIYDPYDKNWSIRNVSPAVRDNPDMAFAQKIANASDYRLDDPNIGRTNDLIRVAIFTGIQWGRSQAASDEATTRALALVERIASHTDMLTPDEANSEARAIQALRTPVDPRIALVVTALVQNGIGKPVAPLFARDVLKALDGAVGS